MVQWRAARYACNRYHNTSSVTDMLQTLTWPTLQQRRLQTKLIMFYKIVHHIVAVPTTILIPTDSRIRQFYPFTYRHPACPFTLCRGFFTPKIVGTFYMQGYKIKEKTAIVPPVSKLSGHSDIFMHSKIRTSTHSFRTQSFTGIYYLKI